jgi:hypothetical protein
MVSFKQFLEESAQEEYISLLDDAVSMLETVGENQVWINDNGKRVIISITGDNYVQMDMDGTIIKTQKLYKDGEVTNYDLACSRLKGFIAAIKAEQFISQETEE